MDYMLRLCDAVSGMVGRFSGLGLAGKAGRRIGWVPAALYPTLQSQVCVLWDIRRQFFASILLDHDINTETISFAEWYVA